MNRFVRSLSLSLAVVSVASGSRASEHVRLESGRLWVECHDAPLAGVLREIADVAPMDLWLDDGLDRERVSLSLAGVTTKEAVEKLFENAKVNYILYLDPVDPEKVAKVYAGSGGGGRLGRAPTVEAPPPPEELEDPDLDPDTKAFLDSPESQEVLRDLKKFLKEQESHDSEGQEKSPGGAKSDAETDSGIPPEIQELLQKIPDLPGSSVTPGSSSDPSKAPDKEKKEPPQL